MSKFLLPVALEFCNFCAILAVIISINENADNDDTDNSYSISGLYNHNNSKIAREELLNF